MLIVDDNEQVSAALRLHLARLDTFDLLPTLDRAELAPDCIRQLQPEIMILDLDTPGRDSLDVLAEVTRLGAPTRTIIFTGHTRFDLVERALDAGAWGYISKNDGIDHLSAAIELVLRDEIVLSPEARLIFHRAAT